MSRVGKLELLLQRLPPKAMDAEKLASSYHLPVAFVQSLVVDAKNRRGLG